MSALSLCLVVRDEARGLAQAIASFADLADEVIVVDTGSVDETVQVAHDLGAQVIQHVWQDDFSTPRNLGFEACTKDWIFVINADERLLPGSEEALRTLIDGGTSQAYWVTRRDVNGQTVREARSLRLGRRSAGIRVTGRIHERIDPPLADVGVSDVVIEHDVRSVNPVRRLLRDVRLLELELRDRPGQIDFLTELARRYHELGDRRWTKALTQAFRSLDPGAGAPPDVPVGGLLDFVLALPITALPPGVTQALASELSERWYPDSAPLLLARARLTFRRGNADRAFMLAEKGLRSLGRQNYECGIHSDEYALAQDLRRLLEAVSPAFAKEPRADSPLPICGPVR